MIAAARSCSQLRAARAGSGREESFSRASFNAWAAASHWLRRDPCSARCRRAWDQNTSASTTAMTATCATAMSTQPEASIGPFRALFQWSIETINQTASCGALSGPLAYAPPMVTHLGPFATTGCEPRQARKGATVAADSGAEVWLGGSPPAFSAVRRLAGAWDRAGSRQFISRRGVRAVEGARLESVYIERYRGFESLPLRHTKKGPHGPFFVWRRGRFDSVPRFDKSAGQPIWALRLAATVRSAAQDRAPWMARVHPSQDRSVWCNHHRKRARTGPFCMAEREI